MLPLSLGIDSLAKSRPLIPGRRSTICIRGLPLRFRRAVSAEGGMEDARNKSSASRMRFSGPTEGNSAKPFARQPPLLGFGWVGDSLLKGSLSDIAARSSGEIAATERESSDPVEIPRGVVLTTLWNNTEVSLDALNRDHALEIPCPLSSHELPRSLYCF
jgi:hypothetical protein